MIMLIPAFYSEIYDYQYYKYFSKVPPAIALMIWSYKKVEKDEDHQTFLPLLGLTFSIIGMWKVNAFPAINMLDALPPFDSNLLPRFTIPNLALFFFNFPRNQPSSFGCSTTKSHSSWVPSNSCLAHSSSGLERSSISAPSAPTRR